MSDGTVFKIKVSADLPKSRLPRGKRVRFPGLGLCEILDIIPASPPAQAHHVILARTKKGSDETQAAIAAMRTRLIMRASDTVHEPAEE